jgi:hypothetical protein
MFAQMFPCIPYLETLAFNAETKVASEKQKSVAEISVGRGGGAAAPPPPPPTFVENDEFSKILTYKRAKNSLFECKWGGGVGNLKVLSEI